MVPDTISPKELRHPQDHRPFISLEKNKLVTVTVIASDISPKIGAYAMELWLKQIACLISFLCPAFLPVAEDGDGSYICFWLSSQIKA